MRRVMIERLGLAGGLAAALSIGALASAAAQETDEGERSSFTIVGGTGGSYLGVRLEDVDRDRAQELGLSGEYGAFITSVVEGGPAATAGLRGGDVIVRWNGDRLESVAQLQRRMGETPAGRTVSIGIRRDGADREISVELGDRRDQLGDFRVFTVPRSRSRIDRDEVDAIRDRVRARIERSDGRLGIGGNGVVVFGGRPRLGVSIQSLGDQLASYFGVDGGALVTSVNEGSPAEAAGLRAGDVITGIDGESVESPGELLEALRDLEAGPVEVTVVREGARRTFTVRLEERGPGVGEGVGEGFGRFYFEDGDGEAIQIRIPRIVVPGFEMPAVEIDPFEIPSFDVRMPRIQVVL